MAWPLLKAILILPGTVLVLVPGVILLATKDSGLAAVVASPTEVRFWVGLAAAVSGLALAIWTSSLFLKVGRGTPAPWDPPQKLVVRGPYRHVRNPMITGVLLLLLAEATLLGSWPIAVWLAIFAVGNAVYFPLVEAPGLVRRFGDDYREYWRHVPRWIPRASPWRPEREDSRSPSDGSERPDERCGPE